MLDYLDDLESDLSAFHRVDDIYDMEAGRFFRLAHRIAAYEGVMAARLAKIKQDEDDSGTAPRSATPAEDELVLARLANEGWMDRG